MRCSLSTEAGSRGNIAAAATIGPSLTRRRRARARREDAAISAVAIARAVHGDGAGTFIKFRQSFASHAIAIPETLHEKCVGQCTTREGNRTVATRALGARLGALRDGAPPFARSAEWGGTARRTA